MISQEFKAHVGLETYVILGNDALIKCEIPSFVSDLVAISGWIDNKGNEYFAQTSYGTSCFQKRCPPSHSF